jgi:hypothetical protein
MDKARPSLSNLECGIFPKACNHKEMAEVGWFLYSTRLPKDFPPAPLYAFFPSILIIIIPNAPKFSMHLEVVPYYSVLGPCLLFLLLLLNTLPHI